MTAPAPLSRGEVLGVVDPDATGYGSSTTRAEQDTYDRLMNAAPDLPRTLPPVRTPALQAAVDTAQQAINAWHDQAEDMMAAGLLGDPADELARRIRNDSGAKDTTDSIVRERVAAYQKLDQLTAAARAQLATLRRVTATELPGCAQAAMATVTATETTYQTAYDAYQKAVRAYRQAVVNATGVELATPRTGRPTPSIYTTPHPETPLQDGRVLPQQAPSQVVPRVRDNLARLLPDMGEGEQADADTAPAEPAAPKRAR
jgi:hypothetical protein